MLRPCWNCGAPPACPRCGSTERRRGRSDCAECHRTSERQRGRGTLNDEFEITPAMRRYLQAFDAWLADQSPANTRRRAEALGDLKDSAKGR